MSNVHWNQVKSLNEHLDYSFIVTKKLQCLNLTTSFFENANILPESIGRLIAEEIKESMIRSKAIFLIIYIQ